MLPLYGGKKAAQMWLMRVVTPKEFFNVTGNPQWM